MKKLIKYGGSLCDERDERAIIVSVKKSIKSGNWQAGPEAAKFEQELCDFLDVKHAILTTSGSCAGLLALSALELPKGSEVIISAVTFPTIFNIILQCGLVPVVVDAKIGSYNFCISDVEKAITKKTKAIIAIHACGNPVDWIALKKVAEKHKIKTILDNCDGFGTTLHGRKVETYADISITSFHAAHIVTMGVGGGVFTNDKELALRVRQYRDWGRQANTSEPHKIKELPADYNPRFVYDKIGYNFQILELQAAMGRVQLKKADKIKEMRSKNFHLLCYYLKTKYSNKLTLPFIEYGADVCWFALPITYGRDRGRLVAYLEKNGIETRSMFSGNITKHPAYKNAKYRISGKLNGADHILKNSFWISCHPSLTKADLTRIIKAFDDFFA